MYHPILLLPLVAALAAAEHATISIEETRPSHWRPKTHVTSSATSTSSTYPSPPDSAIRLSIPLPAPLNAAQVPADFVGFGFETAFLPNYAEGTFSENLINSVAKRLSAPITIRIGGTSGDRVPFNPDQQVDKICIEGDCPVGSDATYTLGPAHFEAFKRFQNQRMTFQAPMGPEFNLNESVEYVKRAYTTLGPSRVAGIALGNEIDIYASQYSTNYTLTDYVRDATALQTAITTTLNLSPDLRIFEVLDLASPSPDSAFTVRSAWQSNIDALSRIKAAATHWYQFPTSSTSDYSPQSMQTWLLNHTFTAAKFNADYLPDLTYLSAHAPEVDYILSETGSSLIGPPLPFQDSFGAAIWAVDFNLYAMSMGVKRVDASQRPAAHHSLWVPDGSTNAVELGEERNLGPQVRGLWFAVPLVAEFVGMGDGKVVRVWDGETGVVYGMFGLEGGLERVALVNLKYWSRDTGGLDGGKERGSMTFEIPVPDPSVRRVEVKRLRADAGVHALGYDAGGEEQMITWGGETWSYSLDNGHGHFVDGVAQSEIVEVCHGFAMVSVEDAGAAIVFSDSSWSS